MTGTAFVTGADRGLGLALVSGLLERRWRVFAGQYLPEWPELAAVRDRYGDELDLIPLDVSDADSVRDAVRLVDERSGSLDLLINNAGVASQSNRATIRGGLDYDECHRMYDVNALGPVRTVESFLPLLDKGSLKRLCFVSSEAGSVERSQRTDMLGYCASKSALNMYIRIIFNTLRPDGYTFRVYHPGWLRSYMGGRKNERATLEPEESALPALEQFLGDRDEGRLALVDWTGAEWPW